MLFPFKIVSLKNDLHIKKLFFEDTVCKRKKIERNHLLNRQFSQKKKKLNYLREIVFSRDDFLPKNNK